MKFSVLMSIYAKENPQYFNASLKSIINQTVKPSEVVIVKDGPLPSELDMVINQYIRDYPNLFKIVSINKNVGLGLALREGVKNCSFDVIARMDTDDIAHKERFRKQIEFLENNPNIAIVGTNALDFDGEIENIVAKRVFPEKNSEILKFAKRRCPFLHPTIMFRKEAVLNVGNYTHLLWFEDYQLFLKLLSQGYQSYNIQENLLYFRSNQKTFERRGGVKYLIQEIYALRKFYKAGYFNFYYYITNILIRSGVRLLGNNFRKLIYNRYLRN
jgi:glycosyltransferase involved in cell wall biosynthesis